MEREIGAIVVLYNVTCRDSSTCQALQGLENPVPVIVYDNSTRDMGNRQACRELGWTYLGGEGNRGLSVAYNAAIQCLRDRNWQGLVCLFDDDSAFDENYFRCLREVSGKSPCKIFVPVIVSGEKILSPVELLPGQRVRRFAHQQELESYRGEHLSAINSGMAVDISLFDNYRYDEHIFLDGIDHTFVADMKKRGEQICVIPYRCIHGFSGDQHPPKAEALTRFSIFARDYGYILRNQRSQYWRLVGKRAAHLIIQYRALAFAGVFFRNLRNPGVRRK